MAEPTDRDLEQARELRRKLEQHNGDGLCCCAACEDITAMYIAAARSEGRAEAADDARLLEAVVGAARHAAMKLETMYARREVSPRAELDGLIALLGSHDIKGVPGYGTPSKRNEAWDVAKRLVRATQNPGDKP